MSLTSTGQISFGPHQLADHLGLYRSEIDRAREYGLLPAPDVDGARWSAAAAAALADQVDQLREKIRERSAAEQSLGATRCAARLAELTGLPVAAEDISALAERHLLQKSGYYKEWPLYRVADVEALAEHPDLPGIVAARTTWLAASIEARTAADRLGWRYDELLADAAACGVQLGPLDRYATADIDRLAADPAFSGRRLLGPEQAAAHFDVRRVDFEYAVTAGWITAARYSSMQVGRRSWVTVPLYRVGDVEALREIPGVDWNEVREVAPGKPSALRAFVRRPPTRAQIVRRVAADLGTRFAVEVWAYYNPAGGRWEIDWETVDGVPTREQVVAAVAADPVAAQYRKQMTIATEAGAAVNWARAMLEPGAAVICDTETTDLFGAIIEIAVIDAHSGVTLLDTLVNPGVPIQSGAQAIHGITDADVAGAPSWAQVVPQLLEVTAGRQVLCYNAEYDAGVVRADTERAGLRLDHLADDDRWGCVMLRRSDWTRSWRWLPLGGGHRALGDTQAAREVLLAMTAPAHDTARPGRRR